MYLRVYVFNVTNKDAFLNHGEKLKVEEVGPFVYSYNGRTHLPYWGDSDKCNRIDGASDCSKFANRIGPNDTVTIYRKPICRPMTLERVSEETVEGMRAY
ncbi:hypothetical protein B566_EDAN018406, partial [Ephemera danica]